MKATESSRTTAPTPSRTVSPTGLGGLLIAGALSAVAFAAPAGAAQDGGGAKGQDAKPAQDESTKKQAGKQAGEASRGQDAPAPAAGEGQGREVVEQNKPAGSGWTPDRLDTGVDLGKVKVSSVRQPVAPSQPANTPGGKGRLWGKVTNEKLP